MKKLLLFLGIAAVIGLVLGGYTIYNSQQTVVGEDKDERARLERIRQIEEMQKNEVKDTEVKTDAESMLPDSRGGVPIPQSDEGVTTKSIKLGSDILTVSLILPSHLELNTNQGEEGGEWVQLFIDTNDATMLSLYVERPVAEDGHNNCHMQFCFLKSQKTITTEGRTWEYLGGSTYGDAGLSMSYSHIYKTVEGEYVIYLTGGPDTLATDKESDLGIVFGSLDFVFNGSDDDQTPSESDVLIEDIKFDVPKGWELSTETLNHDTNEAGRTYDSPSVKYATDKGEWFNNDNDLDKGARLTIASSYMQVNPSIEDSKDYAEFRNDGAENCSNCERAKIVSIDGVPAAFNVSLADDHGGIASFDLLKNNHHFQILLTYAEDYEDYEDILEKVVNSIELPTW